MIFLRALTLFVGLYSLFTFIKWKRKKETKKLDLIDIMLLIISVLFLIVTFIMKPEYS